MLNIYIRKQDIPKQRFIDSVDIFFNSIMYSLSLDNTDVYYIRVIDSAEYMGNGHIKTVFGITSIENLSTGCKALILIHHYNDKIININECGENVLDIIYNKIQEGSIFVDFVLYPYNYNPNNKVILHRNGKTSITTLSRVFDKLTDY